ncbi:hypothetical protein WJ74_02885 [Burkholderia ubonensis]|nr:hypothetical protein WJ74_02885 [Burkholderia ubonensis]KVO44711.1 hypothetical protein WJ75_32125 [Burkholderia ubonensis]
MFISVDPDCLDDPLLDNSSRVSGVDKVTGSFPLFVIPQFRIGASRSFRRPLNDISLAFYIFANQITQLLRYLYPRKHSQNLKVSNHLLWQTELVRLHVLALAANC